MTKREIRKKIHKRAKRKSKTAIIKIKNRLTKCVKQRKRAIIRRYLRRKRINEFQKLYGKDTFGILLFIQKYYHIIAKGIDLEAMDPRKGKVTYSMKDVIWSVVIMFLLRQESRNQMNETKNKKGFKSSVKYFFGIDIPHLDTCNNVLESVDSKELKTCLYNITRLLLKRGFFESTRRFGRHILLFDGSGLGTVSRAGNWSTTVGLQSGEVFYKRGFVSLSIVGPNNCTITVDWEEINTSDGESKEDCELNAATRMLNRFKSNFKRLAVILVGDGLYATSPMMRLCRQKNWFYVFTLKDGSLKKSWEVIDRQVDEMTEIIKKRGEYLNTIKRGIVSYSESIPNLKGHDAVIENRVTYINDLYHNGNIFHWLSLNEEITQYNNNSDKYYAVITNIKASNENAKEIMLVYKTRNQIEDQFNTAKNRGFKIKHKFSRSSSVAAKNYLTLANMATALSSLTLLSDWVQQCFFYDNEKSSYISLVKDIVDKLKEVIRGQFTELITSMRLSIPDIFVYSVPFFE